jgi:pyrroloquinoline quinone biosynthesis protein E
VTAYRPYALLAELTYRCPLHCPYCSNPTSYPAGEELSTSEWQRVLAEAAALGVLQAGFSGGEPLGRRDLPEIIRAARAAGMYTNLITSGLGLDRTRAESLRQAGLDSVQLSFQSDEAPLADAIAGAAAYQRKLIAAQIVREAGLALSLNCVLHRANIDRLPEIVALAEQLGAERLELANVQFYGWAFENRHALLPTRAQVERARLDAQREKQRRAGRMDIFYVLPDYYEQRPKPCLAGWGRRYLTVNPVGEVLPCPTSRQIPGLVFENIRARPLAKIWRESDAFNRFRGTDWLPEPCHSCPQREIDFGGCRCQAALLADDPAATDPVCTLSPHRPRIDEELANLTEAPWVMRENPSPRARLESSIREPA